MVWVIFVFFWVMVVMNVMSLAYIFIGDRGGHESKIHFFVNIDCFWLDKVKSSQSYLLSRSFTFYKRKKNCKHLDIHKLNLKSVPRILRSILLHTAILKILVYETVPSSRRKKLCLYGRLILGREQVYWMKRKKTKKPSNQLDFSRSLIRWSTPTILSKAHEQARGYRNSRAICNRLIRSCLSSRRDFVSYKHQAFVQNKCPLLLPETTS
mgnify:CR=1 FL=1